MTIGKTILLLPLTWGAIITLLLIFIFERDKTIRELWRNVRNRGRE